MLTFLINLIYTFHLIFIELPCQLFKKLTGKQSSISFRIINGKLVVVVRTPNGYVFSNSRFGGSPAIMIYIFFGGLIYAEEHLPEGIILHEIGHIVEPAAKVSVTDDFTVMHRSESHPAELAADDFAVRNGGRIGLLSYLINAREDTILEFMESEKVFRDYAEYVVGKFSDFDLRIARLQMA